MSDNSGNLAFDPNSPSQGQGPTQGQGQFDDPNRGNPASSEIHSEGRGPTQVQGQGQGKFEPTTRSPQSGSQPGSDPSQAMSQSADPDFDRQDPGRRFDDQTRRSGPGGGQDHIQQGQQGQWRQGGQTAGDNLPYGGGGRDPRQGGYGDQVVGGPQDRSDPGGYGVPTGTGPGSRPDDQEIRGDGGFGGKPPIPERVMGSAEKVVGKATGNIGMYERGQQHKTGGY